MNKNWKLHTHGDPIAALHTFIENLWEQAKLDGIIFSSNGHLVLDAPEEVKHINPFRPLMRINTARLIPSILNQRPGQKLAALLRPCEMRALRELSARGALDPSLLLTISFDCLGTYSEEDFDWRIEKQADEGELTCKTLKFAPQGGILSYRFRPACQMCTEPGAFQADINIGVIGLPVRETIMVNAPCNDLAIESITDGRADESLQNRRQLTLSKVSERHTQTRQRVMAGVERILPQNLDEVVDKFNACADCQNCMNVCPICAGEYPRRNKEGQFERNDVKNWLISCAGCGMCEQACAEHLPIQAIFAYVRETLAEELVS